MKYILIALFLFIGSPLSASDFSFQTKAPIILYQSTTPAGNTAATTEDTLQTYTMPAGMFSTNGQLLRITVIGSTANNADTKTLRAYFGAVLATQSLSINTPSAFAVQYYVLRTGSNTQTAYSEPFLHTNSVVIGGFAQAFTQTDTAAIVIKSTGQASVANANDIANVMMTIELLNP